MNKTHYVLGFAFDNHDNVVLIEKTKPEWQRGKLNGVGGAVENHDKSAAHAMAREFKEETGATTSPKDWEYRLTMSHDTWKVDVFALNYKWAYNISSWTGTKTDTDETVCVLPLNDAINDSRIIHNLPWLIYLCLDKQEYEITNVR